MAHVKEPKYRSLVTWAYQPSQYSYQSPVISPAVTSFMGNVDRVRSIALMPAVIVAHASGKGDKSEGLASGVVDAERYIASIPVVGDGFKPFFSSIVSGAWT